MSKEHLVRDGDCISSIAFEHGFHPRTLWNHPQNAALREKRREGTVLKEGDIVFIPDLQSKQYDKPTEAEHVFKMKAVPEMLKIQFLDQDNKPRAGRNYILNIDGNSGRRGKTDGSGFLIESIPPNAGQAHLILYENYEKDEKEEYDFNLGYLQPITELAGVQTRLNHLGYLSGSGQAEDEGLIAAALLAFQTDYQLSVSGAIDDETRDKLKEIYGA